MKNLIFLITISCLLIIGPVSAYHVYINCSDAIQVGQPLKISIDSNFPAGTSFDLVFYEAQYTATEISRQIVTIQQDQQTQYKLFDTNGLKGGNYKVEVQFHGDVSPSSDSIIEKLIKLIDRSGEITITSPSTQNVDEALRIEGSISKLGNKGVQIEVRGPNGPVFGPTWIETKNDMKSGDGQFIKTVPIGQRGDYIVNFQDINGFIGTVTFHVTGGIATTSTTTISTSPTTKVTIKSPPTTIVAPTPVTTKSSISIIFAFLAVFFISGISIFSLRKKN
ncbi:MAG: hypothetical protein ABR887_00530 [Methanoregulaceae archaeon]